MGAQGASREKHSLAHRRYLSSFLDERDDWIQANRVALPFSRTTIRRISENLARDYRRRAVGGVPKSTAGHARRSRRLPARNPASGAGCRSAHPVFGDALHGGRLPFIAENADRRARQRPLSAAGTPTARARQTDGVPAGAGGDARLACRHQRLARSQQPQRHLDRHRNRQQGLHPQHAVHPLATLYGGADRRADPAEPRHYPTLWHPAAGRGGAQRYRAAAQAGSRPAVPLAAVGAGRHRRLAG